MWHAPANAVSRSRGTQACATTEGTSLVAAALVRTDGKHSFITTLTTQIFNRNPSRSVKLITINERPTFITLALENNLNLFKVAVVLTIRKYF